MFSDIQSDHPFYIFKKYSLESIHIIHLLNCSVHSAKPLLCKSLIFNYLFLFIFLLWILRSMSLVLYMFFSISLCFWFPIFACLYRLTDSVYFSHLVNFDVCFFSNLKKKKLSYFYKCFLFFPMKNDSVIVTNLGFCWYTLNFLLHIDFQYHFGQIICVLAVHFLLLCRGWIH